MDKYDIKKSKKTRKSMVLNYHRFKAEATVSVSLVSQDIANNKSVIRLTYTVKRTSGTTYWSDAKDLTFTCDGQTQKTTFSFPSSVTSKSTSKDFTITHGSDGTKSVSYSVKSSVSSSVNLTPNPVSGSYTIKAIPRYANITKFVVNRRDETSVTFDWAADATCDYAWYSTNNGSSWAGLPNGGVVGGLAPNTTYNFKLRIRRKDSQLITDSGTYQQYTYDYPYCTSTPTFNIGDAVTFNFYNPVPRTFNFYIIANGKQIANSWSTSGTSYTGINAASSVSQLYATIPDASEATYQVKVVYGSSTRTRNNGDKIKAKVNDIKPSFSKFYVDDANPSSVALTGSTVENPIFIKGVSIPTVTIKNVDKASAKQSARMKSYTLSSGGINTSANYSDTDDVIITSTGPTTTNDVTVSAIDSRNISFPVTRNDIGFKDYFKPIITEMSASRSDGGVGDKITLHIRGSWWGDNFGVVDNELLEIKYYYKKSTSYGDFIEGTTVIEPHTDGNVFYADVEIVGEHADGSWDIVEAFYIRATAIDVLSTSDFYEISASSGTPAIAISERNVAIGQKYDSDLGGALQVNGDAYPKNLHEVGFPKLLPDGDLSNAEFWCSIPNGWYWFGNNFGSYYNYPASYGFIHKTGHYLTDGSKGDFSVMFYKQATGAIWRLSGNASSTTCTWNQLSYIDTYNTGEQIVGISVDGKNIYQKTFNLTNVNNYNRTIGLPSDRDEIIDLKGMVKLRNGNEFPINSLTFAWASGNLLNITNVVGAMVIAKDAGWAANCIFVASPAGRSDEWNRIDKLTITVQYTKV